MKGFKKRFRDAQARLPKQAPAPPAGKKRQPPPEIIDPRFRR